MAEQEMDRSEAASPYKLHKARERGQVSKSTEIISAVVFTGALFYLYGRGWESLRQQFRFDQSLLLLAGHVQFDQAVFWQVMERMAYSFLALVGPFLATLMLAAVVANLIQTGPVLSFEPIKPDWTRISPAQGIQKLFTVRTLFDALRTCLKLVLLGTVVYYALKDLSGRHFFLLAGLSPLGYLRAMLDDVAALAMKMALMLGGIAVLDLVYSRRQFANKMRMSKRELKDEVKNRDGDPRIRARVRQLRRELLKRSQSVQQTARADVLITNPTHVAVALRYVHGEMESPQLVAKGAGVLAAVMRKIAASRQIPIVQNRALARALYRGTALEQHVPPSQYAEVARIIVWVFAMRQARAGLAPTPGQGARP